MRILSVLFVLGFLSAIFAAPPHTPHKPLHVKGVVPEIFERASFEKKREVLRLEFKEKQVIENKRQELKQKIKALELERKLLEISLQEARATKDEKRINDTLSAITQQEYKITQEKNQEKLTINQMEADMVQKLNKVLGY